MARIPGVAAPLWYKRQWIGEIFSIVAPIIATSVTIYIYLSDKTKPPELAWALGVSVGSLLLTGLAKTVRAYSLDKKQAQEHSPGDLRGAVHVLYALLCKVGSITEPGSKKVRITIHKVVEKAHSVEDPEWLEQVIPYVGGEGGRPGRRFPIRSGIIGLAVRDQALYVGLRENNDYLAFVKELVQKWGYTEQDARRLSNDRFSWMAIPIFGKQDSKSVVIGVVFLDSDDRDFFTGEVKQLIITACAGIAAYIDERYK